MGRNEAETLYYGNLSDDEKIFIQWYRDNPNFVYTQIALVKLLDWEIMTEEKCQGFQEKIAKYAENLQEIGMKRKGKVMDKEGLKDWLFELLNENDSIFTDISLYDEADTFFIKSIGGQRFSITVNAITDNEAILNLWSKKNPGLIPIALGILNLKNLDVLTEEEYNEYLSAVVERSDTSGIGNVKELLEKFGKEK